MSLESELLEVISKYGLATASNRVTATSAAPALAPKLGGGAVASYIREIITGDVAFDAKVLAQVTDVLAKGSAGR
jgi:type IV secretory pathway VirB2 component (pilin)